MSRRLAEKIILLELEIETREKAVDARWKKLKASQEVAYDTPEHRRFINSASRSEKNKDISKQEALDNDAENKLEKLNKTPEFQAVGKQRKKFRKTKVLADKLNQRDLKGNY